MMIYQKMLKQREDFMAIQLKNKNLSLNKKNKSQTLMALNEEGYCNPPIMLTAETLLENVRKVQRRAVPALRESEKIEFGAEHPLELEVEMETGTGKTFVYTKTMFELNKRYGWSKFIVIVPSVAIREGVRKSLEITAEKFIADYGKRAKVYVYDSARPQDIHDFSTGADIEVLVMNYQAFASTGKDHLRIYQALDDFQSRVPMDMIAANRPILILDEATSALDPESRNGWRARRRRRCCPSSSR